MGEENYAPWPSEPVTAKLDWLDHDFGGIEGWLHFWDPDGQRAALPVTKGNSDEASAGGRPVWHIDLEHQDHDFFATVSPSIHLQGHYHSPNPVRFRIVDELPDAP